MFNLKLAAFGAGAAICGLASCAGQQQQVVGEQHDHDAECRKFGAATETPTYLDCRVALRSIEQLVQTAASSVTSWMGHGSREDEQREGPSEEGCCSRVVAGQLIVLECGLNLPVADLLVGLDP